MTIDYHISVGDPLNFSKIQTIQNIINETFHEIDIVYNKWNSESEISRINSLSALARLKLSPSLYRFLQRLDFFFRLSEGRFDPTIEPLQKLWKEKMEKGKSPTNQEIDKLKSVVGWKTLHLENGFIFKEDGRTQLDLGGVAKGLCVDLLSERLALAGFQSLYVEWGGEIRTKGLHPSGRPWKVFISHLANPDPSQAIAFIELFNQALATSGDYFQHWKIMTDSGEEKEYSHIFNPLTFAPLEIKSGSIASASLLADDCVTADALAKVLMLFDSIEEARNWIEKLQEKEPNLACWIAARQ